jgi:hypothetical protein
MDPAELAELLQLVLEGLQGTQDSVSLSAAQQLEGATHHNALVLLHLYVKHLLRRLVDTVGMTGLDATCQAMARLLAHLACDAQLHRLALRLLARNFRVCIHDMRVEERPLPLVYQALVLAEAEVQHSRSAPVQPAGGAVEGAAGGQQGAAAAPGPAADNNSWVPPAASVCSMSEVLTLRCTRDGQDCVLSLVQVHAHAHTGVVSLGYLQSTGHAMVEQQLAEALLDLLEQFMTDIASRPQPPAPAAAAPPPAAAAAAGGSSSAGGAAAGGGHSWRRQQQAAGVEAMLAELQAAKQQAAEEELRLACVTCAALPREQRVKAALTCLRAVASKAWLEALVRYPRLLGARGFALWACALTVRAQGVCAGGGGGQQQQQGGPEGHRQEGCVGWGGNGRGWAEALLRGTGHWENVAKRGDWGALASACQRSSFACLCLHMLEFLPGHTHNAFCVHGQAPPHCAVPVADRVCLLSHPTHPALPSAPRQTQGGAKLEPLLALLRRWVLAKTPAERAEALKAIHLSKYLLHLTHAEAAGIGLKEFERGFTALRKLDANIDTCNSALLAEKLLGPQALLCGGFYGMPLLQLLAGGGWLAQHLQQEVQPVVQSVHPELDLFHQACHHWKHDLDRRWVQLLEPLLSQVGTTGEWLAGQPQLVFEPLTALLQRAAADLGGGDLSLDSTQRERLQRFVDRWQPVCNAYQRACAQGATAAATSAAVSMLQGVVNALRGSSPATAAPGQQGAPSAPEAAAPAAARAVLYSDAELEKRVAPLRKLAAGRGRRRSSIAGLRTPEAVVQDTMKLMDQAAEEAASADPLSGRGLADIWDRAVGSALTAAASQPSGSSSTSTSTSSTSSSTTWYPHPDKPYMAYTVDPSLVQYGGGATSHAAGAVPQQPGPGEAVRRVVPQQLPKLDLQQQAPKVTALLWGYLHAQQGGSPSAAAQAAIPALAQHSSNVLLYTPRSQREVDAAASLEALGLVMPCHLRWVAGPIPGAPHNSAASSKTVRMTTLTPV